MSEQTVTGLKKVLQTTINVICPAMSNLQFIDSKMTLSQALDLLVQFRILSLPVWFEEEGKFDAFIGCHQIVNYVLSHYEKSHEEILETKVSHLLKRDDREFYYVLHTDTVQYAVDILCGKDTGNVAPHRIGVFAGEELVSILTQSRVIEYLSNSVHAFSIASKTVAEIGVATYGVISVNKSSPVKEAFLKISEKDIQSVAIVDDDDKLIGKISAQDIKYAYENREDLFDLMELSCEQYLALDTTLHNFRSVKDTTTFDDLIDVIVESGVHRVFVVDDNDKMLGIVSLTDILLLVSNN